MFKVHFCQSLRSLREMERIIVLFLHADYAKSAENFLFHGSRWRWRGRWLRAMISQSFAQSVVVQLATNFVNPAKRHPLEKLCPLAQSAWQ